MFAENKSLAPFLHRRWTNVERESFLILARCTSRNLLGIRINEVGEQRFVPYCGHVHRKLRAWQQLLEGTLPSRLATWFDNLEQNLDSREFSDDDLWLMISVSIVHRNYHLALACLDVAERRERSAAQTQAWAMLGFELRSMMGRVGQSKSCLQTAAQGPKPVAELLSQWTIMLINQRDFEEAVQVGQRSLAMDPKQPLLGLQLARLCAQSGEWEQALAFLDVLGTLDDVSATLQQQVFEIYRQIGKFAQLETIVHQQMKRLGPTKELYEQLLLLACWKGNVAAIKEQLQALSVWVNQPWPSLPFFQGIVAALEMSYQESLSLFEKVSKASPFYTESRLWRAEMLWRVGRNQDAWQEIDSIVPHVGGFVFGTSLVKVFLNYDEKQADNTRKHIQWQPQMFHEISPMMSQIQASFADILHHKEEERAIDCLKKTLTSMAGNRSSIVSLVSDNEQGLRTVPAVESPRSAARRVLELIGLREQSEIEEKFQELMAKFPEVPVLWCHRGEYYLWIGDYVSARADFHTALEIEARTRWGYIGLAGVHVVLEEWEQALDVCEQGVEMMHGTEGPSLLIYRGEAHRRLQHWGQAQQDLQRACEQRPGRLSAWINLALCMGAQGEHEQQSKHFRHVAATAPVLVHQAGRERGLGWYSINNPSNDDQRMILEQCLVMMRGNRSSSKISYFRNNNELCLVTANELDMQQRALVFKQNAVEQLRKEWVRTQR
jgi:tetratricopeptide (TPR) repeat protein